jgi:hypothetical protein
MDAERAVTMVVDIMGERIRKYGTGFSPVARCGSVGVDTKDASRGRLLPIADRQGPANSGR